MFNGVDDLGGGSASVYTASLSSEGDGTFRTPIHFTATWVDAETLALTGSFPNVVNELQFRYIKHKATNGVIKTYVSGPNIFSWDDVLDHISVDSATFADTDVFEVVMVGPDRYSDDPGNFKLTAEVLPYPLRADSAGISLITAAQDFEAAWEPLGPRIACFGYNRFLTGNLLHVSHCVFQHFLVSQRFTYTHINGDFGNARHFHY